MTRSYRNLLASTAALAALTAALSPATSLAQTADGDVDAVVVTAERIGLGQTRAVSVISAADIASRPLGADITQSLVKAPGLQVSTGDSRGGSFSFEIYMRGLNKEQIGLTIDGVPSGDARFNGGSPPQRFIEPSNVNRITVSQSSGDIGAPSRFALGGFIDFTTDDPAATFGGVAEAGYGSYDFWRGYLRLDTGEIAPGLKAYATYSHQRNDIWAGRNSRYSKRDHAEFKLVKDWSNGSYLKGRVSWNKQFDNDFNIITLQEFQANKHWDRATDAITGNPTTDLDFGGALGGKRKDVLAYINGKAVLGEHASLTVNPYYQTLRGESYRYQDRARQLAGSDPYAVTGYNATGGAIRPTLTTLRNSAVVGGPVDMRVTPRDRDRYGVTSEFKVSDLPLGQTIRVGGWWEGGKSTEERRFYRLTDSLNSLAYNRSVINYVEYARATKIETTMLYAQDSIAVIPDVLRIDAGFTWFDVKYTARSPLEYQPVVAFSQHSKLNPKVGFSLKAMPGVEVYGGYAQNFSGIPEDAFLGSTAVIAPGDLDPIQSENFDLGARYAKGRTAFSVQAFSVHLKNGIGIVPRDPTVVEPEEIIRGNVATRAANILGSKNQGFELTALAGVGKFDFYGSYSYQDAKYDDAAVGSVARKNADAVAVIPGAGVRDIPKNSGYAEISYKPLPAAQLQLNGRFIGKRVGGHIVAPTTFAEVGVDKIPGYTVIGFNASYVFDKVGPISGLKLQFNVDNLFDKSYLGSVSSSTANQPEFGLPGRTLDRYFIGAPRTYTVSLQARF
jgi:outer membrane receptor for ferrienterochelin and colicin